MPAELLSIPDIVVGSVVGGDLVLRNVVVSTDSQLPSNIPQLPPSGNTGIVPPQHQHGQLDQFVSDLKVPANLPPDVVVVLIDSKTNSIIKASLAESEDFISSGAYFIGAFDRSTADKVVADMIDNPIPSNEYLAGKFIDSAVKLGVTSYIVGVEVFRAIKNAKEDWKGFVTLKDRVMNPPASILIKPATSRFPLKLTITAHQLDPNLSPESMEEVSGQIGSLFPNGDMRGISYVKSTDSEFTITKVIGTASELQSILTRLTAVNDRLATQFPSGIITVVPDIVDVQPPVVYEGDEPVRGGAGGLVHTLPYTQDYVQPALAQQYLDLNQAIAEIEDNGDDIIFGADHPFERYELQGLLEAGDATIQVIDQQAVIVPNPDVFKAEASINPRYEALVNARDALGASMGVPAGCQPTQPHILPPTQVPAGCFPIPPRDFPPYDPPQTRPPRPPTPKPCAGRKPCVLVGYIAGGKKGTHKPSPRPRPHNSDGSYDDDPKLDHWDALGNMIDQNGNVMHV